MLATGLLVRMPPCVFRKLFTCFGEIIKEGSYRIRVIGFVKCEFIYLLYQGHKGLYVSTYYEE